ncbi:MAG: Lrp/AsnC family transcriptional regulator [Selenomonadaceae bacterium]|nr:Lrp/AsnC family transcriptional regulator [Selenomonadaceae bacterium]
MSRELLEILEHDARRDVSEIAKMLGQSEYEVERNIKRLEDDKIILAYNALIDWEKFGDESVTAIIEISLTPQREVGFDAIAERIYRFDEVRTVYLMSGDFDLLVIIEGKSLKEVANFVATRLSTIDGVTQTRSHFLLKPYKKDGVILKNEEQDRRLVVSP